MHFYQRLQHERLFKGWSIEQLSQASGVTVNRLSLLERNLVEVVSDNLKDCLAATLGVDFAAPPSSAPGPWPVPNPTYPRTAAPAAVPATPEPVALNLPTLLLQQLEAAARSQGRSLHGEILVRLEASLASDGGQPVSTLLYAAALTGTPVVQLSDADLDHITDQVAQRLQQRAL